MSDDAEYALAKLSTTSLSESNWKDQHIAATDSQTTFVRSRNTSFLKDDLSLYPSGPIRQWWKSLTSRFSSRLPTGWRFGAYFATFQAVTVLVINTIILIWSAVKTGGSSRGLIFQGDCDKVDRISTGIHFVINVLSTLLLGASNYIMQSLSAPTRAEVSRAHGRGLWLDIGVQSIQNLKHTSRGKRLLWLVLAASSVPLHLFYNSSFFSTVGANEYLVYFAEGPSVQDVSENANSTYNWTCGPSGCPAFIQKAETFSDWEILSQSDCLKAYANDFVTDRSYVVAVVGNSTSNNTFISVGSTPAGLDFKWICSDMNLSYNQPCSSFWTHIDPLDWKVRGYMNTAELNQISFQVDYCINYPVEPKCQLEFNLPLLAVVIAFNAVKVVCMAFAAVKIKDEPLVTIGDAIASFIDDPDPHTRGLCLASRSDFDDRNGGLCFCPPAIEYRPQKIRWLKAATSRHLILTIFIGAVSLVFGLFGYAVEELTADGFTGFSALWQLGIGKAHSETIIKTWGVPSQGYGALLAAVLISNSPQLILSMIYLVFNSFCTTLFLALEWSSFAHSRKPLRVSNPRGEQRSTYFLQIPTRFGLPMMAYSVLLHWLVSQSIFLVEVVYWNNTWDSSDILDSKNNIISCGWSPVGMMLASIVAATLILSVFSFGFFRHLNGDMPLVGSCSAAIAAACHPPVDGSNSLKPLKWGAISDVKDDSNQPGGNGHISLSSNFVARPVPGCYYC
ncbi:hypothetical protein GYMLUDRAFT_178990 [Collybiopsis luxurians FD-317 M1]|uniref:DUF6536 domain-containing protein n=1 Tax=Collybiopsis luxurians FD-317 M1 TaxID=944289 RepID=A0A0D0C6N4_9AGAR|nr:hypothetical protein GYMLUDRAFT_178990 [Collybiopsis luxurians FD-317 M1]